MKARTTLAVFSALALCFSASLVLAQEGEGSGGDEILDVTMTLMPADEDLPAAVTRELDLPRYPAEEGSEDPGDYIPAQQAQEHALDALEHATEARDEGRAMGEAAAQAAQDNREEFGRGERPDLDELRPDAVPDDVPGPPDIPGPPDDPGPPGG